MSLRIEIQNENVSGIEHDVRTCTTASGKTDDPFVCIFQRHFVCLLSVIMFFSKSHFRHFEINMVAVWSRLTTTHHMADVGAK